MTGRPRLVFDTNVLISFALWHGSVPWQAVEQGLRHGAVVASPDTIRELVRTILYAKFDRYASQAARMDVVRRFVRAVALVRPGESIEACRDPKDDMFMELAVAANARTIVSGDRDLLALRRFRDFDILSPAEFLAAVPKLPST